MKHVATVVSTVTLLAFCGTLGFVLYPGEQASPPTAKYDPEIPVPDVTGAVLAAPKPVPAAEPAGVKVVALEPAEAEGWTQVFPEPPPLCRMCNENEQEAESICCHDCNGILIGAWAEFLPEKLADLKAMKTVEASEFAKKPEQMFYEGCRGLRYADGYIQAIRFLHEPPADDGRVERLADLRCALLHAMRQMKMRHGLLLSRHANELEPFASLWQEQEDLVMELRNDGYPSTRTNLRCSQATMDKLEKKTEEEGQQ